MATRIKIRRDTANNWFTINPIIAPGELCYETDTLKFKIGPTTNPNGTPWNDITAYLNVVPSDFNSTIEDYIPLADIGADGGVVGLNNDGNAVIPGDSIIIEGSDNDSFETKLVIAEPSQDRVITIPDETGTMATREYVDNAASTAVSSIIDSAPQALDTLNELAAALGDDANFATTVTNALSDKQDKVVGVSDTEISYLDGVTSSIQNQLDSKLNLSGGTLTDYLTLHDDPTLALHAATKRYVDNVAVGLNFHAAVHVATTENLTATYNNSAKTLSASGSFPSIDGETVLEQARVLIKSQTDAKQNGLYVLTDDGNPSGTWVLTRASDYDNNPSGEISYGDFVFVQAGSQNGGYGFIMTTSGTVTLGSTNINWTQFNAGQAIEVGYGLTESSPGVVEIDTAVTVDLDTAQTLKNKTISSSQNTISIESTNVLDFVEAVQDTIGDNIGAGLLYNDVSGAIYVDESYIQKRVDNVSDTEIGYLNGLNSSIQDQINDKLDVQDPEFSGDMFGHNLTLSGNLIVNGTNTIINTDTLQIEDNEIILNSNVTGNPNTNAFLKIKRGIANDVSLTWNESLDKWQVDNVGGSAENIASEPYVTLHLENHNSDTTNIHGIADTSELATKTYADNAILNHNDNTTNVHGILDTADLATKTYADDSSADAVLNHNLETTNIHGILDTFELATKTYADDSSSDAVLNHNSDTINVHGIADTADLATKTYADDSSADAVLNHNSETTNVHGILNTADLATKIYADNKVDNHSVDTTNIHGISDTSKLVTVDDTGTVTSAMIANGTIINEDISSSASISLSKLATNPLARANHTGTQLASTISDFNEAAQDAVGGILGSGLTYNDGLNSITVDSSVIQLRVTNVSDTEIGYLDGVTSGIQSQIDTKLNSSTAASTYAPISSPRFTGTVSGITKSMVGLGNVDNTSDTNKPVSTATQSALDAKLNLSGGTLTGLLTLSGEPTLDLHAATKLYVDNVTTGINFHKPVRVATTANITLTGTQTIDSVSLSVDDRVLVKDQTDAKTNGIYLVKSSSWVRAADADNNPAGEIAGGDFVLVLEGTINSSYGYVCSNTGAITLGSTDITYVPFNAAKAIAAGTGLLESTPGVISVDTSVIQSRVSGVSDTEIGYLDGVTSAIQTQLNSKLNTSTASSTYAPLASPTFTGTVVLPNGTITHDMIANGTIIDDDIKASAAIAQSKIANLVSDLSAKAPIASPTFTGLVTVSSSGIAFSDGTQAGIGVVSITPIIYKTSSFTANDLSFRDDLIEVSSTSSVTVTLPKDSTTNYPKGTSFDILQTNTGQVTIAPEDDTVIVNATPGLKLRTRWSSCTVFKRDANTWVVYGDLTA